MYENWWKSKKLLKKLEKALTPKRKANAMKVIKVLGLKLVKGK